MHEQMDRVIPLATIQRRRNRRQTVVLVQNQNVARALLARGSRLPRLLQRTQQFVKVLNPPFNDDQFPSRLGFLLGPILRFERNRRHRRGFREQRQTRVDRQVRVIDRACGNGIEQNAPFQGAQVERPGLLRQRDLLTFQERQTVELRHDRLRNAICQMSPGRKHLGQSGGWMVTSRSHP